MKDWNVVVSVREKGFAWACEILAEFGPVARTEFYNVLVMRIDDVDAFLRRAEALARDSPSWSRAISRLVPVSEAFSFQSADEFEAKARAVALGWADRLQGAVFHVRVHRRGFKERLSSQHAEQFLDHALLEALAVAGAPGRIAFDDPDWVIAVETVGNRAGLSLWSREDLGRFPFLQLD